MPDVLVEVRGSWLGQRKTRFLAAVHGALVEAIRIPQDDKVLRLIEHAPENFIIPGDKGEHYTRIEITLFAGRSLDAKRKLYQAIVRNLEPFGVPGADIKIVLVEVPPENWGIRGGHAASDIELGFEVRV